MYFHSFSKLKELMNLQSQCMMHRKQYQGLQMRFQQYPEAMNNLHLFFNIFYINYCCRKILNSFHQNLFWHQLKWEHLTQFNRRKMSQNHHFHRLRDHLSLQQKLDFHHLKIKLVELFPGLWLFDEG